ncbi:GNAT family N-acetyltransferase [Acinetobacter lwoffii]|uniref:GNAT family N-acetyltransferase n=1 Tax=Acinetobacter lwoffii TaxID=28090 RepID=UPI001C22420B|nr:GNAT family N-acetyltransferase [Acinetobacter lwoffii]QXB85520.1 GNAT family N-acetyltransferase [Acinetobacter lwoffii]
MNHYKNIRLANKADIQQLTILMNTAYRTLGGWTTEAGMIQGDRIQEQQLYELLNLENFQLFVLEIENKLLGCIGVSLGQQIAEIGSFAVAPAEQNSGYGKQLLDFAESHIFEIFKKKVIQMSVLNVRTELLAYYQRRGYQLTEKIKAYPLDQNVGEPLIPLHLLILGKISKSI